MTFVGWMAMVQASIVRASGWPSRSTMSPRSGMNEVSAFLTPGMVAERREPQNPQRDERDDAGIDQHAEHQPLMHDARIWRRCPTSRSRSGRGATRAGDGAFIGRRSPWNCPGRTVRADRSSQSGAALSRGASGLITVLARFATGFVEAGWRPRGPAYPRISLVPASPPRPAYPWTSGDGRGRHDRLCRGLARLGLQTRLMEQALVLTRRRRAGIVGIGSPIGACLRCGAGAEASTTGASKSILRSGWVELGELKAAVEELVGRRRRQREHLDVPALELGEPAARADLGLKQRIRAAARTIWFRRPPARRAPRRRGATPDSSRALRRRSWRP